MRVIFSSRPAFGHVFAIAPLARAAVEAGHEVIFGSGQDFLPRLQSWGFTTHKVGEGIEWGYREAAAKFPHLLEPERPEFGARMFVDVLGSQALSDMRTLIAETRPDLVVYEATDLGAGVAAAAAGVPAVCHSLSRSVRVFLDALRERTHVLWDGESARPDVDVVTGEVFLDIWPPSMRTPEEQQLAQQHWSLRPVTWGDPGSDVPTWIKDAPGPLIFVSLGTVFWGKELLTKVIEGLDELDCDALVLAGVDATPDDFASNSGRVRIAGFVNQAEILRRADVVIHHGGAGTLLGTLSQGLPALTIGEGADRGFTTESLAQSGASIAIEPERATPQNIREAVLSLLEDDSYRKRARQLRAEIEAMPSPETVIGQLEAFVDGR